MFFFPIEINPVIINILCTLFTYKDEGGSYDSRLWQALTKVILDLGLWQALTKVIIDLGI